MFALSDSTFGLVELGDANDLQDIHGEVLFRNIRDEFYQRLRSWGRAGDEAAELENNRFSLVLNGISSRAELELAASKLSRLFELPFELLGEPIVLEVNVGFAALDGVNPNMGAAMRQASKALAHARRASRLFEVYDPSLGSGNIDELKLVRRLESAVERGEFELYYQAKIHAGFRTLLGAEALIRWHTKEQKIIPPEQFIKVAERHTVIRPITWWVIKTAVSRLALWPEELAISVNVPPPLLLDNEIISVINDALDIYQVKPSRLVIEVTESIMVANQTGMLEQLAQLRELGVKVSIDDFGTGFSSLNYFRDLPADEIKIDMCFVIPMRTSKKDYAIVKAVIDLAHNFSMRVVAEGVENAETADLLGALGCDIFQGFLFSEPVTLKIFEQQYAIEKPLVKP
ncbi:MAG: EAL domain-containing protein (putative c-di-GMP-specific phosphodiesterase class I) [Halieaceae bacterium]|jgi:EAL domain-containing protein (putative c-di-GMP-specific phosphodiesterase class I)/GGDEF domain-containing protein